MRYREPFLRPRPPRPPIVAMLLAVITGVAACSGNRTPRPEAEAGGEGADSVSVGYGRSERSMLPGAVGSVTAEDVKNMHLTRVEEMIDNRIAGVQVTRRPNGEYSIRIRGTTSFTGSNEPLVVIDGVPTGQETTSAALAGLDPYEVERIDVLKDAGAAMYGVRGAAGVILITTKRGR